MDKVKLTIVGLSYSQTKRGANALILSEDKGQRRLPVIIGASEAQSIAIHLEGLKPYRPLTHDLFLSLSSSFHIKIIEVNIIKLQEGVFFSELICKRKKATIKIDARTSDAVALALKFDAPIYVTEAIMNKAAVYFDQETGRLKSYDKTNKKSENELTKTEHKSFNELDISDLEKELQQAIKTEDYEKASIIRDIITEKSK